MTAPACSGASRFAGSTVGSASANGSANWAASPLSEAVVTRGEATGDTRTGGRAERASTGEDAGRAAIGERTGSSFRTAGTSGRGGFGEAGPRSLSGATKDSLKGFHAPVAYFLGGPSDVAYPNGKDDFSRVTTVPAFLGSIHSGHGGTYRHPGGGWFGETGVAWLKWQLNGDAASAKYFEGADCILCRNPIWEVAKKNMK